MTVLPTANMLARVPARGGARSLLRGHGGGGGRAQGQGQGRGGAATPWACSERCGQSSHLHNGGVVHHEAEVRAGGELCPAVRSAAFQ